MFAPPGAVAERQLFAVGREREVAAPLGDFELLHGPGAHVHDGDTPQGRRGDEARIPRPHGRVGCAGGERSRSATARGDRKQAAETRGCGAPKRDPAAIRRENRILAWQQANRIAPVWPSPVHDFGATKRRGAGRPGIHEQVPARWGKRGNRLTRAGAAADQSGTGECHDHRGTEEVATVPAGPGNAHRLNFDGRRAWTVPRSPVGRHVASG